MLFLYFLYSYACYATMHRGLGLYISTFPPSPDRPPSPQLPAPRLQVVLHRCHRFISQPRHAGAVGTAPPMMRKRESRAARCRLEELVHLEALVRLEPAPNIQHLHAPPVQYGSRAGPWSQKMSPSVFSFATPSTTATACSAPSSSTSASPGTTAAAAAPPAPAKHDDRVHSTCSRSVKPPSILPCADSGPPPRESSTTSVACTAWLGWLACVGRDRSGSGGVSISEGADHSSHPRPTCF